MKFLVRIRLHEEVHWNRDEKAHVSKEQALDKLTVDLYSTCVCLRSFRDFFVGAVIFLKKNGNYVSLTLLRVQFLIKLEELRECV